MAVFALSDTHFNHFNIIRYCDRPFRDSDHMNSVIIDNINAVVGESDVLIHGGDFAFGRKGYMDPIIALRQRIICKNLVLIVGNHDTNNLMYDEFRRLFTIIVEYFAGTIDGKSYVITHYPPPVRSASLNEWATRQQGRYTHLYGHTHNNSNVTPENICVENIGYTPIRLGA